MTTLVFGSLTAVTVNPYNPPPSGWLKPTSANNAQLALTSGTILFGRSSGSIFAIWYDQNSLGAPVIGSKTVAGNATSASNGGSCILEGSNGNGYAAVHNSAGTVIELIKLTASAKDGASLLTVSTTVVNNTTQIDVRLEKATNTLRIYKDGVQIGTDVVDATYNPIYGGVCSGAGRSVSVETYQIGVEVTALTDPIVLGSPISFTTTFTNPITSISAIGLSATNINNTTDTADWPALAEGQVISQSLPAASLAVLFGDGTNTATRNAAINLDADFTSILIASPNNSDSKYIGSVYPLTAGWYLYWEEDQAAGNIIVYSDGRVSVSAAGIYTVFVHQVGDDDTVYQLNLNINGGGDIGSNGGLTTLGLVSRGLVTRGLVRAGL